MTVSTGVLCSMTSGWKGSHLMGQGAKTAFQVWRPNASGFQFTPVSPSLVPELTVGKGKRTLAALGRRGEGCSSHISTNKTNKDAVFEVANNSAFLPPGQQRLSVHSPAPLHSISGCHQSLQHVQIPWLSAAVTIQNWSRLSIQTGRTGCGSLERSLEGDIPV